MKSLFPPLPSVRFASEAQLGLLAGVIAGCASAPPPSPRPRTETPAEAAGEVPAKARAAKPAGLNLRGFPVAFKEGYAAGCESGREGSRRRDETRYKADMNYMMGWNDGYGICAARR